MPTINLKSGVKSWAKRDSQVWSDFSQFYNSPAWRKFRKAVMDASPLCEVSKYEGKYRAAKELDHPIPIRFGGAKLDPRNAMPMTEYYHRRKTRLERGGPLVEWIDTENGKIPANREDIIKAILK